MLNNWFNYLDDYVCAGADSTLNVTEVSNHV